MQRKHVLLVLLLLVGTAWAYPAAQAAPPTSEFGLNTHIATRYGNYRMMNWPADVVAGSGAGWAREDFQWFWIEPEPGRFQWDYYDRMVELLTSRQINVIGVLGYPPGWGTLEPNDGWSELSYRAPDPTAFANFAQAVVSRYRYKIVHWEIWNEPDNPQFWQPQPDPVAYGQLLSTTYSVIKQVAPETNVLIGGLNPFDSSFLQTIADIGAWWAFDILNIHPYVDPAPPEANGEIGWAAINSMQRVAERAGSKPIWVTEFGWSSQPCDRDPLGLVDEQDQANYLVRGAALLREAGVQRILWYGLKDEVHNGYGVLRFGNSYDDLNTARPAFSAFQTLNKQLGGAAFERRDNLEVLAGGPVYALRFVRNAQAIEVIWALEPATIRLPTAQSEVTVVSRDGNTWNVGAENGAVTLYPDVMPLYVQQSR